MEILKELLVQTLLNMQVGKIITTVHILEDGLTQNGGPEHMVMTFTIWEEDLVI